jgi:cytochrome c oxidase subunit 2
MRPTIAKLARRLALLGVGLALAGCGQTKQDIFHPDGSNSGRINDLQVPVFIAAGVVGVLVAGGLIYVLVSGSRRSKTDAEPRQIHGHFAAEITWTIIPFLILVGVAVPTFKTVLDLSHKPADRMQISVFGQQWWWSYEYDTNHDGTPEIVTANELVVPVDTDVELLVQSRDVIHSFWIPALFGTRDAVPGRVQYVEMKATKVGEYDGQCKEFCGLSHANMRAKAVVLSKDDYAKWVADQSKDAVAPSAGTAAADGLTQFKTKCASCHQINGVDAVEGKAALISGHAPNLTHLMSRTVFASAQFPLWVPNADGKLAFNRNQLEAWLRDPPGLLPMAPDEARGMPNLHLSENDIDNLIAYLETLGPYPANSVSPTEAAP